MKNTMRQKLTKTMSGSEFKLHFGALIASLHDDDEVYFGAGNLSFYRPKDRGTRNGHKLVAIEFNEVYTVVADPDND
jgi:hypothetical protein